MNRYQITAMTVSAATLVGIAGYEGYSSTAYVPVKGDVPTIGWGTTAGVKKGDTIEPTQALQRLYRDTEMAKTGISRCVKVPLSALGRGARRLSPSNLQHRPKEIL